MAPSDKQDTYISPLTELYWDFDERAMRDVGQKSRIIVYKGSIQWPCTSPPLNPSPHMLIGSLPVEVWEVVIDFCCSEDNYRRYEYLRACALTCKAWLPRSRYNLFRRVRFRHPAQVNQFLDVITAEPTLADFVLELHVTPAQSHKHGFIHFASAQLSRRLRNVRQMFLSEIKWNTLPPTYYAFIGKYAGVSAIEMSNIVFHSVGDMFRLLWSFPQLAQLETGLNVFTQPVLPGDCEKIIGLRKPSACSKLSSLALWGLDRFPPVLPALGDAVADLFLHQPDTSWPWENVCETVSNYTLLRSITMAFCVGFGYTSSEPMRGQKIQVEAFMECKERFIGLLLHVNSTHFRRITVRFAPSLLERKDGKWMFTYRSTRARAIELMFGEDLKIMMTYGSLARLDLLEIHVQENLLARDAVWWCDALRASLGPVPREIRAHVDYFCPSIPRGKYGYSELWQEDVSTTSVPTA